MAVVMGSTHHSKATGASGKEKVQPATLFSSATLVKQPNHSKTASTELAARGWGGGLCIPGCFGTSFFLGGGCGMTTLPSRVHSVPPSNHQEPH